jgi:hypothetical protein
MRFGLEVRVPFLDQGLGQVIRNLEAEVLLGKSERKFLLRNLFASELTALDTKRKKGFSSPVNRWWQLGLQQLATDVFADSGLVRNNDLVRRCITGGQERNDAWSLFNLLSLCLWEDYWMGSRQFCDPQRLASYAKLS